MSGKQCWPRWEAAFCGVSSGSILFAHLSVRIYMVNTVVVGYYGFMLEVFVYVHCTSVHLYFRCRMITWITVSGFSPYLVCAVILGKSGLGLLMGKFCQFFDSYLPVNVSMFLEDNLSNCQWIFTKLGRCIDTVEIWFGIAIGQILSFLKASSAHYMSIFLFPDDNWNKYKWILTKLGTCICMCIDIVEIWCGLLMGNFFSVFDRVLCLLYDSCWVLLFHIFVNSIT